MKMPPVIEGLKNNSDYVKALLWAFLPGGAFVCGLFFQSLDNALFGPIVILPVLYALGVTIVPALRRGVDVPWNGLILSILCYCLYIIATVFWSPTWFQSWQFAHILLILPFMFFTIVFSSRPRENAYACFVIGAGIFIALVCWAYYQFFFLFDIYGPRIHHPFLNPNDLGALFAFGLMIAAALFLQATSRWMMIVMFIIFTLLAGGVFITQGRAILLAIIMCFVGLTFMLRKSTDVLKFRAPILLLVGFILYALVDVKVGSRLTISIDQLVGQGILNVSVDSRVLLWESTLKMAMDNFWFGVGLGNFHYIYPQYRSPRDGSDGFFTHMDPLQFWAEGGILLPILFYAVLVFILLRTINVMKTAPAGSLSRAVVAGAFCGMLAMTLHAHLSFDLYQPAQLIPLSMVLALWYVEGEKALADDRRYFNFMKTLPRKFLAGGIIIMLLVSAVWAGRTGGGMYYIQKAREYSSASRLTEARDSILKARMVAPDSYSVSHDYYGRMLISELEALGLMSELQKRQDVYRHGLKSFEMARIHDPYDSYTRFYQAIMHERGFEMGVDKDGRATAIKLLNELLRDDPLMLQGRMGLASIYEADNKKDEAFRVLNEGLTWPKPIQPFTITYFMSLAQYYAAVKDEKMYNYLFEEAKAWNGRIQALAGKK